MFDQQNAHRRKASLVPSDDHPQQRTSCYVHQLLEEQRQSSQVVPSSFVRNQKLDKGMNDGDETHSRLLTKLQLSEMASEMRNLSKTLTNIRLKLRVKAVFLLVKAHDETLIGFSRELVDWLLSKDRDTPYLVYVENTLENNRIFDAKGLVSDEPSREGRLKYWTNELCAKRPQTFDFAITLGGDGTLLYASWLFQRTVPPVLSFAMGSLGFLTKFDYGGFRETLTTAFRDGITVSLRLRFEGTVMRSQHESRGKNQDLIEELVGAEAENDFTHKPDGKYEILNDIVVDRGPNPTMSALEIFGDGEHFTTVQADGVCVATPTGSTAYNLAAGGSLCHPDNPVILLTAICAHTLSFRPIILPDTVVLRVGVPYDARTSSWASFDGRERVELHPGDYVTISASRFPFANVMQSRSASDDWINSISRTLNWNSRERQKGFKEWQK